MTEVNQNVKISSAVDCNSNTEEEDVIILFNCNDNSSSLEKSSKSLKRNIEDSLLGNLQNLQNRDNDDDDDNNKNNNNNNNDCAEKNPDELEVPVCAEENEISPSKRKRETNGEENDGNEEEDEDKGLKKKKSLPESENDVLVLSETCE
jgi:hypothetical protein